ncbi:MAG: hypothetical protein JXR70_19745 [Spirochaetales bacterium]|nr:hypothetical protein [Spirochaetales bacterium]
MKNKIFMMCLLMLMSLFCLTACFDKPMDVLQNAINELGAQPGKWNMVIQNAINSLGSMSDQLAKDILGEVQLVYDNALGNTLVSTFCGVDFIGTRVKQNLEQILAKFKNVPYNEVIMPVICNIAPDYIKVGDTRIIQYYGYELNKFLQQGQYTVDIEYGNPKSIVRQNVATVAVSTNYQLSVDIQAYNFAFLDYARGPKLVLKWKNNSVEGKSELSIQGEAPTPAPTPVSPCSFQSAVDYEVTIHTADVFGAGTNADVFVTLYGECGNSSETELDKPGYNDFERNDTDSYNVVASMDLGTIRSVKIRHDNSGSGSGWKLDYLRVRNTRTGQSWNFSCNRWLATDEDDKKIWRIMTATGCN